MRANPDRRVLIEGHGFDEPREITPTAALAIGERRAQSVMNYLIGAGISASRLTTSGYGTEFPACNENNERCWAQNRRVDFLVSSAVPSDASQRAAAPPADPPRQSDVSGLAVSGQGILSSSSSGQPTIRVALGAVPVGKRGAVRQITIVNTGPAAIDLDAPQPPPKSVNIVRDECAGTHLEPMMSCRASFQLSPRTIGAVSVERTYASGGAGEPKTSVRVVMTGQGLAPEPPAAPPVQQGPVSPPPKPAPPVQQGPVSPPPKPAPPVQQRPAAPRSPILPPSF